MNLLVGRLGRAVGLKGEIELRVESDAPERFVVGAVVLDAQDRPLTIRAVRKRARDIVVAFEEVADRTGAEKLTGAELFIRPEQARELDADEYWDHDLIGCEVFTSSGGAVGRVTDVMHSPANDILVVADGEIEHLIPLVRDVIRSVEVGVRLVIEPIAGLLDEPR